MKHNERKIEMPTDRDRQNRKSDIAFLLKMNDRSHVKPPKDKCSKQKDKMKCTEAELNNNYR